MKLFTYGFIIPFPAIPLYAIVFLLFYFRTFIIHHIVFCLPQSYLSFASISITLFQLFCIYCLSSVVYRLLPCFCCFDFYYLISIALYLPSYIYRLVSIVLTLPLDLSFILIPLNQFLLITCLNRLKYISLICLNMYNYIETFSLCTEL